MPSGLPPEVIERAFAIAGRVAEGLDYVGVLGVEMFYMGAGFAEPLVISSRCSSCLEYRAARP